MKIIIFRYVNHFQKILITIALFLVYAVIIGFMALLLAVLKPKIFSRNIKLIKWMPAEGYENDIKESARQS